MSHEQYKACIDECLKCLEACNHCFDACLKESHMMADCIRLDRECADLCAYAIQVISRNSPLVKEICAACAKVCEACGNECNRHPQQHCRDCATACFECAEACRKMAA
jgi:hypothetical protein